MSGGHGYVIRGGREGADRLLLLGRSLRPGTTALLDRIGVPVGARCLDVGCGPGEVTVELARRAGTTGLATGVDLDPVVVELARERATAAGVRGVGFAVAGVDALAAFGPRDVVYSRNVVQHLSDPVGALRAMWEVTGPGGVLVAEDADFPTTFAHPPQPAVEFWVERYSAVLRRHGGDPESGRKLASRFVAAGAADPQVSVVQRAYLADEAKLLLPSTLEGTRAAMTAEGVATADEIDRASEQLRRVAEDPGVLLALPLTVQVWARRPAG